MPGYLLDTNVISETRKLRVNQGVAAFLSGIEDDSLFISVLTIGELNKGIASKRRTDPIAADSLTSWVESLEVDFAEHVLPINSEISRLWGTLSSQKSLPVIDTLIAATAIVHGLTLVTQNTRDVKATGVLILDPWS